MGLLGSGGGTDEDSHTRGGGLIQTNPEAAGQDGVKRSSWVCGMGGGAAAGIGKEEGRSRGGAGRDDGGTMSSLSPHWSHSSVSWRPGPCVSLLGGLGFMVSTFLCVQGPATGPPLSPLLAKEPVPRFC